MPADWPEHPGHELVWQYLRNYARHFDLYREHFEFGTVDQTNRAGRVNVVVGRSNVGRRLAAAYRGVVIANGHNWDPRWPDYPGTFAGTSDSFVAVQDAGDLSRAARACGWRRQFGVRHCGGRVAPHAAATFHSLRRQLSCVAAYFRGMPVDECGDWALALASAACGCAVCGRNRRGKMLGVPDVAAALPRPDHRLFETHPVINSRWPYAVAQGAIRVKPDVKRLDGDRVRIRRRQPGAVDLIIYATGYKLSFPFIDREHSNWRDDRPELYLNIFHPERDDLFVAGLIQPDSGQFGLVDYQSQLIAA